MPWSKEKDPDGTIHQLSMFDYYERYMKSFGELLTDMERNGVTVYSLYFS